MKIAIDDLGLPHQTVMAGRSGASPWPEVRRRARLYADRVAALGLAARALDLAVDAEKAGRHAEAAQARATAGDAVAAAEKCGAALAR